MNKVIWIISQETSTPDTGIGARHYYLAKELVKQGHNVYLILASNTHLLRTPPELDSDYHYEKIEGVNLLWVKMPSYKEAHSKKRVLNWFFFAWKLRRLTKEIKHNPDAILYSSPPLVGFLGAKYLAKKLKASLVFEVRDIWPLTLIKLGGYSKKHPFIRLLQWIEKKAYKEANVVISNLKSSYRHMSLHGMDEDKFAWIPNGFCIDEVKNKQDLDVSVRAQVPEDKFVVGYTGTIGVANALEYLVAAAEMLIDNKDIVFVVVGDGKLKSQFVAKGLDNMVFIDSIPKAQIQSMLSLFDICYIGWNDDELYQFGIGAQKIPEYLYSGKPVLHSYSGSADPIKEAGVGVTVPAESPNEIAAAILQLFDTSNEERLKMGRNGRRYAMNNLEYARIAQKLSDTIL